LKIAPEERFVVPQVLIIDRKGVIRAQSPPLGDANLQDEGYLRKMIEGLLKEAPAKPMAAKPAAAPATKAPSAKK